jgi:hypothetical protein
VGATRGELSALAVTAGLTDVHEGIISVEVGFDTFEEWWDPFTLGVGPAGDHVAGLDTDGVGRLRERCRRLLPTPPFTVEAAAWWVRARPRATPA